MPKALVGQPELASSRVQAELETAMVEPEVETQSPLVEQVRKSD